MAVSRVAGLDIRWALAVFASLFGASSVTSPLGTLSV